MPRTVDIAVTHEIVIDGEKSWIKYGVVEEVPLSEDLETARKRISEHVNQGVLKTVNETVEAVRKVTE